MYFQIIDNNEQCQKAFVNGDLVDFNTQLPLTRTWKYTNHLSNLNSVEYAYVNSEGLGLDYHCPSFLQKEWTQASNRISSIINSVRIAKCDLDVNCIYDFIPHNFLISFLEIKEEVIKHILEKKPRSTCQEILTKAHILTEEMNTRKNIYMDQLCTTNYNIFGTKTGRLSNAKSSIPILTMKKEDRVGLVPRNDLFVEFDFNAAELRTLLALSGQEQPEIDIHDWNIKTISRGSTSREEIKKRTFAWLYNPEARDQALERLYSRDRIKESHYDNGTVKTPFSREIDADERRSLNYLIQSTSSDVCIEQAFKLRNFFKNCKTKVCYLMHDSVILDYSKQDVGMFDEARSIFSNTRFGKYLVNASIGKNFGQMRFV